MKKIFFCLAIIYIVLQQANSQIIAHICFKKVSYTNSTCVEIPWVEVVDTLGEDTISKECLIWCNFYIPEKINVETKISCMNELGDKTKYLISFVINVFVKNDYIGIGKIEFRKTRGWEMFQKCVKDTTLSLENLVRENVLLKCNCVHSGKKWDERICKLKIGGALFINFVFSE